MRPCGLLQPPNGLLGLLDRLDTPLSTVIYLLVYVYFQESGLRPQVSYRGFHQVSDLRGRFGARCPGRGCRTRKGKGRHGGRPRLQRDRPGTGVRRPRLGTALQVHNYIAGHDSAGGFRLRVSPTSRDRPSRWSRDWCAATSTSTWRSGSTALPICITRRPPAGDVLDLGLNMNAAGDFVPGSALRDRGGRRARYRGDVRRI